MNSPEQKLRKVVEGGYCVGCGVCACVSDTQMKLNEFGEYVPEVAEIESKSLPVYQDAEFVCPSLNENQNEDVLAKTFLGNANHHSEKLGVYDSIYGGYVKEGQYRQQGTSGGFGTWIGSAMFRDGLIDGVIHAKECERKTAEDPFFKYGISTSLEEIHAGSRTKYHVMELSDVIRQVRQRPGKYLFIGVPCMVKAIRRLQIKDPLIRESIRYTMSLVCGHLKSVNWTISLGWAKGIQPGEATGFRYRTKGPGISARAYVFTAYSAASEVVENSANVTGGKFNQGALMLEACNFCDDVVGETADITIGDAWLPQFELDSQGTNMLIVRNRKINDLIQRHHANDAITVVELSESQATDAQAGGFRQRGEGLSYRLHQKDLKKLWRPVKRIQANSISMSPLRKLIYQIRHHVAETSRIAFRDALRKNDYSIYQHKMSRLLKRLRLLEIMSSAPRIVRKKIAYLRLKV